MASAGYLQLNPNLRKAVRLAGEDNSFFISCLPHSTSVSPVGDSRVRARRLNWKHEVEEDVWVGMDVVDTFQRFVQNILYVY